MLVTLKGREMWRMSLKEIFMQEGKHSNHCATA